MKKSTRRDFVKQGLLVGGALASGSAFGNEARVRRYPAPTEPVSSPYSGPERFSLTLHQGLSDERFDLDALERLAPHIDMVRTGNAVPYPNGDERNRTYGNLVISPDPYLERVAEILDWDRILLIINDKDDHYSPSIDEAVNASETGFVQRMIKSFPYIKYVQVYNEPCNFDNLCGGAYVPHLAAAYNWIQEENDRRREENEDHADDETYKPKAEVVVVSAATFGVSSGLPEFRRDLDAGLLHFCDIVAFHDYSGAMALEYASLRREYGFEHKPLWMTETGIPDWSRHTEWYDERLPEMEVDMKKDYVVPPNEVGQLKWDQHIFWYSFHEGRGTTQGHNQFGIIEQTDDGDWRATNDDMFTALRARPSSVYHKKEEPRRPRRDVRRRPG